MLTADDFQKIGQIVDKAVEKKTAHLVTKDDVKLIVEAAVWERTDSFVTKDDIKHLPTKEEFYQKMDEVMGELKAIREEQTLLAHRLPDHEDRLEKLEKIHPDYRHL